MPNRDDIERYREDPELGLKLARAICREHGLASDCRLVTARSQLVFSSAGRHIIKVFASRDEDFHKAETAFLSNLHRRLPVPTPELVASGRRADLPYVVMEELRGVPLEQVWTGLAPSERRRLIAQLAEAVRTLHSLPRELFEAAPFEWDTLIDRQREGLLDSHRAYGLDELWLSQVGKYVDDCPLDPHNPDRLAPLHTELMQEHILVRETGGHWAISGLLDFEPSMVGHIEYDFCAVGVFLSAGDRDLFRHFLSSYGYCAPRLTGGLSRRIMAFLLLHRYSHLTWFLSFLPPGTGFTKLAELEQYWYGF